MDKREVERPFIVVELHNVPREFELRKWTRIFVVDESFNRDEVKEEIDDLIEFFKLIPNREV